MSKTKNLQPWLDYFRMLRQHADKGYLLMKPADHEAYVTQPALYVLAGFSDEQVRRGDLQRDALRTTRMLADAARHISQYAAWLAAAQKGLSTFDPAAAYDPDKPLPVIPTAELSAYLDQPFALHVVQSEPPNDPLFTLLLSHVRKFWRTKEKVEVITYDNPKAETHEQRPET